MRSLVERAQRILPLHDSPSLTIAVVGELARTPRYQGAGSESEGFDRTHIDLPLAQTMLLSRLAGTGVCRSSSRWPTAGSCAPTRGSTASPPSSSAGWAGRPGAAGSPTS